MAGKVSLRTTFETVRSIEPFYSGGEITISENGDLFACTIEDEDCVVVDAVTAKPLVRIDGDGEAITSLVLTQDASHLIICSRSLSMRIYQLSQVEEKVTAHLLRSLKPHTTPVITSTTDPSGSILVTGASDGVVKVWDIRGGYCSHTFHGHGGLVTAVELFESHEVAMKTKSKKRKSRDLSTNGTDTGPKSSSLLLASAGDDGKIKIWDLAARQDIATLNSHSTVVKSICFSVEQNTLLSASRDRTIVLWDVKTWKVSKVIPAAEELESAGFILKGKFIFAGGENGVVRVWSTTTGAELSADGGIPSQNDSIVTILPNPSSNTLVSVLSSQVLLKLSYEAFLGDANSSDPPLTIVQTTSGNHDEVIDMACVGPQKSLLVLADNTESPKVVSIDDKEEKHQFGSNVATLAGHDDVVICLDSDVSGTWLATGSKDNSARLWRIENDSCECVAVFAGHTASIGAISLPKIASAGGKPPPFLITGSEDKTVKKWDTLKLSLSTSEPQNVAKAAFTRVAHEKDINAIDSSPIAPIFASASQDRTIKIWSAEDASTLAILRGHKRGVWSVRFSPANASPLSLAEGGSSGSRGLLVSGSGDNTVKVWSLHTYTCLLTFEGHQNSVLKVLWLPVVQDEENEDNREQRRPNQPMIASASSDTLVKLWSPYASADSDHLLTTLDNHTDRVWSLASPYTSHNGKTMPHLPSYSLISGAADAKLNFWRDTTSTTIAETSKAMNERIEQDQILQNHILAKNYREVITLALALNHPGRLLRVFEDVVNLPEAQKEADTIMGVKAVDDVLGDLSQQELFKLLERIRDWNTNARTANIAQRVLNCLFKVYPHSTWIDMAKNRNILKLARSSRAAPGNAAGSNGMKDIFRALEAYTDRHYKRMEELIDESYLLEYTLREMDEITGTTTNGTTHPNGDVVMA